MSRKLFGTDGIRGEANRHPMTAEVAMRLGRALVAIFKRNVKTPKIIVGKDTRQSSYMLENAIAAGITSMGGQALYLGPLPTPAVAHIIRGMRAEAGVMISASHNPFQDNGLKVFGPEGFKLSDALEAELELLMENELAIQARLPEPKLLGKAYRIDDALGRYLTNLKTIFWRDFDLHGWKVVFDGAHGAAYKCGPRLLEELGAEVIKFACEPDGTNINTQCAQEDPALLGKKVLEEKADIGIGVDGDADRLIIVDETGQAISGEHLMFHLASHMKEIGRLNHDAMVTTSMANQALVKALRSQKIQVHRTQVGDRYVSQKMMNDSLIFGGETSGHFIFLDHNTTADGLFSALEVLATLDKKTWKASDLGKGFELLPQKLVSIPVKEKKPLEEVKNLTQAIADLETRYGDSGRVNVRYSGTESLLRLMIEGPEAGQVDKDIEALSKIVHKELA